MKVFTKIALTIALISIGLGICLLLIVGVSGSSLRYTPTISMEDRVRDVKGMDIRMDYGEIYISQGDGFSIEAKNLYKKDQLESYVSNGVWVVSHKASESFSILGFDIPLSIGIGNFRTPSIHITVPEGFKAENIGITMEAGRLKAENLHADRGVFRVDAGSLEIDGLIIEEESSYFIRAGQIHLKQVDIGNINVECDVGAVIMKGTIRGDNEIQCDVGTIKLDLDDNMDLYFFDIDSDLGNAIINNKRYHSFRNANDRDKYKGSFQVRVDVGNINMDFSEY